MATLKVRPITLVADYTEHHGLLGTEAAGASFKRGNLISATNGLFNETAVGAPAAAAKNKLAVVDSGQRLDGKVGFVDPDVDMVFKVTATGAALTAALAYSGLRYGLGKDAATGYHTLLLTDTTNAVWELVATDGDTIAEGAIGDTNPVLFAKMIAR